MADNKRIQQLDLNLLKVFKALYTEQNMTRTAEILHLTPSAVSHAIKRLRYALNDQLFLRSQNKMVPTPACQRMAPAVIENLSRLQQALRQWGEFDPDTSQHHFHVGMHDALEPSLVPQLAKLLARLAPNVELSSIKVDRNAIERDLAAGRIDMAIDVAIPVNPPVKRLELFSSDFVVLMRRGHPYVDELSKQKYLAATHLNVSNRPIGMTAEDTLFHERGVERKSLLRCQNYFAARELVRNSDQILTLPTLLALRLLDEELVIRPLPFSLTPFPTSLYWHQHTEEDTALSWLRTLIVEKIEPS